MRVDSLTFIRFAAAVIVLFFHFGQNTDLVALWRPFIVAGPAMVTFFFTLSGFVMLISHYNKASMSLRRYFVSRAARIFPAYFFALYLTAWLVLGYGINDIYSLILSTFFLQAWVSPYPIAMNTPGWSLSVEVFFYVNFPIIIFLIQKYQPRTSHLLLFAFAVYVLTQVALSQLLRPPFFQGYPSFSHDLVYYFPLSHLCSFLMGISGGVLYKRYPQFFNRSGPVSYLVLFSGCYLTYFFLQNPHILQNLTDAPLAYGSSFYAWLALTLILCVAHANNVATRLLAAPFMVYLGDISYSVYILQKPIHLLYEEHLVPRLALGPNGEFYLFCAILIAFAGLTYKFIEKPGSKLIIKIDKLIRSLTEKKSDSGSSETSVK